MSRDRRIAEGGRIDRSRPLGFRFNGRSYLGLAGDTLASALLANGVRLAGRSFKYHRPRGLMSAGVDEPNILVDVVSSDNRWPNLRATEVDLTEGLVAYAVNAWPSVGFDVGAINDCLSRFLPAGFYYKTFMLPHWHFYEWAIRRAAGMGRLARKATPERFETRFAHCDVLVVGGGPAGLAAAQASANAGARVVLAEQDTEFGGSTLWRDVVIDSQPGAAWTKFVAGSLAAMPDVRMLARTTAVAYYDHNQIALIERLADGGPAHTKQRLWQVRAKQIVLATGALERPLVFPGNDLPGVMLASGVQQYAMRYGVRAGVCAVIFTNNDTAFEAARIFERNGIRIAAIVDQRPSASARTVSHWQQRGIQVFEGASITATRGRTTLKSVTVQRQDGTVTAIDCDLLAMSGGWNPTVHLFSQSGGRLRFDDNIAAFVPDVSVQSERSVGGAKGCFDLAATLTQATATGMAAAESAGCRHTSIAAPVAEAQQLYTVEPGWRGVSGKLKAFVDFQNDVTVDDIALSARENFVSVEHLKRYTTLGMAPDQGKTANVNAIAIMAALTGKDSAAVGTTRYRPPFTPVPTAAYAGRRRGELFHASRRTPMHDWHTAHGAAFELYGEWLRPAHYLKPGENREMAVRREALAVRRRAGIFDGSPLGKIEVCGPDAATFLDRIYANTMSNLKVGRLRYGLMLDEQGVIIDDGVTARLAADKFVVGTTSGGALRIAGWLEEWLQCEWRDLRVLVAPVTGEWSVPTLTGPRAREILSELGTDIDLSQEAFPHMAFRVGTVAGIEARLMRVSFTGELSYEINVPSDRACELWEKLAAAADSVAEPVGIDAWMLLRAEKGYLHVGSDTDGTTTPGDVGWGHVLKRQADFVGKRSLLREANLVPGRMQFVAFEPINANLVPEVGEHVRAAGTSRGTEGFITSSEFSPILGRGVALGQLRNGDARLGEEVSLVNGGARLRVVGRTAYDPTGERLNA